jgi:bacteriocin-like protein
MKTVTTPSKQNEKNELSKEQLDAVSGGIHITKVTDKSSPNLFVACCTGKHFS